MSTSSSSNSAATSTTATTTNSQYPTEGSSFGALKYNLNEKFNWYFGYPTAQEIFLYANLAINLGNSGYYIFNQDPTKPLFTQYSTVYPDAVLVGNVSNDMTYEGSIQVTTFSPSEYATQFASKDGLFGLSWFPWNVYGLTNSDGNYCVRYYYGGTDYIQANPMCWDVLKIKAVTTLKLLGISLGIFFGGKLVYKYATKKN